MLAGQRRVRLVVAAQRFRALLVLEQVEGREGREVQAFVEDQARLDSAIGEKDVTVALRQTLTVFHRTPFGDTKPPV